MVRTVDDKDVGIACVRARGAKVVCGQLTKDSCKPRFYSRMWFDACAAATL